MQSAPLRLPRKVRVGVIGTEGHLEEVLRPLAVLPDVEIVAYADANPRGLANLAKRPPMAKAKGFADYRKMMDEVPLDVVGVVNDDGARAAATLAVLERGLHCVAEKPLAITRADLAKVKQAATHSKGKLAMMTPLRYSPPFLAVREVVASGEIGEVILLGGQKSYKRGATSDWKNKRETYGSTMLWIGPHLIDLFYFAGRVKMTEAFCWQTNVGDPSIGIRENVVGAVFRLANGGVAEMRMDYLRPDTARTHGDDRLRVAGTKGVVEYTEATGVTVLSNQGPPRRLQQLPAARFLFADFLNHVYNNGPNMQPLEEIFHVSDVIQAAEDSSQSGRAVKV
ncbi:MAG: Gfo/Idh/MocA family oxidoreductase [Bryobacter sp.]